jgi:hypothetical protein
VAGARGAQNRRGDFGSELEISSDKQFHWYPTSLLYAVEVALEEFFEMAGASVMLFSALELKQVLADGN